MNGGCLQCFRMVYSEGMVRFVHLQCHWVAMVKDSEGVVLAEECSA